MTSSQAALLSALPAGSTVLITGATGGIGLVTARELAQQGHRVLLVGRNPSRTEAAAQATGAARTFLADLSELRQVRRLAQEVAAQLPQLDLLVNNAGALYTQRQETREGIEQTWALNHLSPFLLTRELLPLLRQSAAPRVVTVASAAHAFGRLRLDDPEFRRGYGGWAAYAQSKLANILFARELSRREPGLLSSSVHPGMVATGFAHNNGGWLSRAYRLIDRFALTPEEGAQTTLHAATAPLAASGRYYSNRREATPAPQAQDDGAALRLWSLSEAYLADL
ncbi:SDR family NAD(P)-dependent oxidoreductase [Deinococcus sp. HMF7604]|uniref:SDR family NAD(P)-dependent oxidoreductase n=1 Tax=Deinococcus betulae TaxID=2873312 RepID=UPI001CC9D729|nr:SDR family NAD(P)-dependent oxidoreductase [Deinococcus betulae]